jgi:uncharacterized protein (DUF58 family)
VLVLVGANVQAGWLYVIAAGMLGVVIAGLVVPPPAVRAVVGVRRVPARGRVGDPVEVELVLHRDRFEGGALSGSDAFLGETPFVVDGGRRGVVRYTVVPTRRGVHPGAVVGVVSGAPFGMGRAERRWFVESSTIVHPRWVEVRGFPLLETASTPNEAIHERRRRGGGTEFFGIREYRPGDSLRHVHWRSTARGGRLLVREFEEDVASRVGILVDTGTPVGAEPYTTLEDAVRCAASIAVYALEAGHPVQLFADSPGGTQTLFEPGRVEAMDWLAGLEPGGDRGLATVAAGAVDDVRRRSTNVLVFASTRRNARQAPEAAAILQSRSSRVVAVVLAARTYQGGFWDALEAEEEASLLDALAGGRAIVYRVEAGQDLAACLAHPLHEAARR